MKRLNLSPAEHSLILKVREESAIYNRALGDVKGALMQLSLDYADSEGVLAAFLSESLKKIEELRK